MRERVAWLVVTFLSHNSARAAAQAENHKNCLFSTKTRHKNTPGALYLGARCTQILHSAVAERDGTCGVVGGGNSLT